MKKLIILFTALVGIFLFTWGYKITKPINRPDEYTEGVVENAGAWWQTGKVVTTKQWMLDETIEPNYVPVPGEENLYMVVDDQGNIVKYRQRVKQLDGSWLWNDVNPDIPEDYEAVEGLENVYKVTDENGNVSYFKYIRNADDTYAFVSVDENGEMIGHNTDATYIDGKHVHITGNIYELLDDNGVSIGYEKRVQNGEDAWEWEETQYDLPEPDTDEGDVTADSPGIAQDDSFLDGMAEQMAAANEGVGMQGTTVNVTTYTGTEDVTPDNTTVTSNSDGTHTEVSVTRNTETIDGYTTTYETRIEKTYDIAGNLISSSADGPYEVDRERALTVNTQAASDPSDRKDTLSDEAARVTTGISYNEEIASELVAKINADRTAKGLTPYKQSDTSMTIAKLRAADMAVYDVMDQSLPTYGALVTMLTLYDIDFTQPAENQWKANPKSADEINTRFATVDESRKATMDETSTQIGIAVAEQNGYYYISEVFY